MNQIVHVEYRTSDIFDLNFDLRNVYSYCVKFGTLYVIHNKGDVEVEYKATISGTDDPIFKHPDFIYIDGNILPTERIK